MRREVGTFALLGVLCAAINFENPRLFAPENLRDTANLAGLFGILSLGAGLVIISGGIDLSIGSMIALNGLLLALALTEWHWAWPLAVAFALAVPMLLGLGHGLLITRFKMQPFIVTLCGLLLYRGLARFISGDMTRDLGDAVGFKKLQSVAAGKFFGLPASLVVLMVVAILMWLALHHSAYGRRLFTVGRSEEAARFSAANARWAVPVTYLLAGLLTGISGILFAFYTNSVSPSAQGNYYELAGITAAVLGGCSLRGGRGSIAGILLGTVALLLLENYVNLLGLPSSLNFAVMGAVVLVAVLADQIFQARSAKKNAPE